MTAPQCAWVLQIVAASLPDFFTPLTYSLTRRRASHSVEGRDASMGATVEMSRDGRE
jgi:hypothetical protein